MHHALSPMLARSRERELRTLVRTPERLMTRVLEREKEAS